jgi:hypothetical protein
MTTMPVWGWAAGALCAFFVGMAKTGMPGLGILAVPLMVLAVGDARQAAGWLLPILCCADLFAIYYWRRHAAAAKLFSLAPWVLVGMAGGALALRLPEARLRPLVGVIILAMLCLYLWRRYGNAKLQSAPPIAYGAAAGFATTVANAAGPVMSLYLLSKRLPQEEFVATGAWFFFIINLLKLPIYASQGMITQPGLLFGATMFPAVLLGAISGKWLISRIPAHLFEIAVIGLTALSTVLLLRG